MPRGKQKKQKKNVFINNYKGSNQNLFPRSHTSMFGLRTWALVALQPVAYKTGFVEDTFRPKLDNKDITNFQVCSESQGFMFHLLDISTKKTSDRLTMQSKFKFDQHLKLNIL